MGMSERSLRHSDVRGVGVIWGEGDVLGFELVGEDEVCVVDEALVDGHDVGCHIEVAIVAHDRV